MRTSQRVADVLDHRSLPTNQKRSQSPRDEVGLTRRVWLRWSMIRRSIVNHRPTILTLERNCRPSRCSVYRW